MLRRNYFYILIVLLFATANLNAQSQDPPTEDDLKRKIINRELIDVAESKWHYKVEYPELRLAGDKPADGFSNAVKKLVFEHVKSFRKSVDSMSDEDWKNKPTSHEYEMSIGYKVETLNDEFVSVNFGRSQYMGGAHPNHWSFTLNYDLKNNRILKLSDLFKENSNYLAIISKTSIEQISKKQGRYADVDWIMRGASVDQKNFKKWSIVANGLKFNFDPYQVGPYASGSFETIIPYDQFLSRMKSPLFSKVEYSTYIDGSPANWCRNGLFPSQTADFKLAYVKGEKNEKVHFRGDDKDICPDGANCKEKSYLIPNNEVIIGRVFKDYACAWYQPEKGSETVGWLPLKNLSIQKDDSVKYDWAGEWSFYDNDIKFIPEKTVGDFVVTGTAFWRGVGDNVHVGDIGEKAVRPKNGYVKFGGEEKYDCSVKMKRIGKYLLVSDNKNCGGVNVTFDGVYVNKALSTTSVNNEICSLNDFSEMDYDGTVRDISFRLGSIKTRKRQRAYFVDKAGKRQKSYLVHGDEVVVSKRNNKFGCAWYQLKKGKGTVGWISLNNLAFKPKSSIRQSWVGTWEYGEGEIKVIPQKRFGSYKFIGTTFWVGKGEGNVNIGEISFVATPTVNRLTDKGTKDLPKCMVKMNLLGNYLIVSDNDQCGGKNVTFSGIYRKK